MKEVNGKCGWTDIGTLLFYKDLKSVCDDLFISMYLLATYLEKWHLKLFMTDRF